MTELRIRVLPGLSAISPAAWDACAAGDDGRPEPFVSHAFLNALEETGCAVPRTGWLPQHLVLEDEQGNVLAAAPAYLKSHSRGEYVFDHGWADAFYEAGGAYYPKMQVAVPFTPVTGRRFLVRQDQNVAACHMALTAGLQDLVRLRDASSAHITFPTQEEWTRLGEAGLLLRKDRQFHWLNAGYGHYEDFLETLASRKRKALRKERREALSAGIEIEWLSGTSLTEEAWDAFFRFYMDTGARKWGAPYLKRAFFLRIWEQMADQVLLVMARRAGRYIAGALNFIGAQTLYGRYWGCIEPHPGLHFEVCYHQAMDYAIAHGLKTVEAGAQGEHKLARGYMPVSTYSAHHIVHPGLRRAVTEYLTHERAYLEEDIALLSRLGPFRRGEIPPEQD